MLKSTPPCLVRTGSDRSDGSILIAESGSAAGNLKEGHLGVKRWAFGNRVLLVGNRASYCCDAMVLNKGTGVYRCEPRASVRKTWKTGHQVSLLHGSMIVGHICLNNSPTETQLMYHEIQQKGVHAVSFSIHYPRTLGGCKCHIHRSKSVASSQTLSGRAVVIQSLDPCARSWLPKTLIMTGIEGPVVRSVILDIRGQVWLFSDKCQGSAMPLENVVLKC